MTEPRKPIRELRNDLKKLMIDIALAPSQMKKREDLEQMISVYGKFAETKKSTPLPERSKGGRPKSKEVEGAEKDGIAVPKKPVKEKTQYAADKEKRAKATIRPSKLDDDSDSDSDSDIEVIFQHKTAAAKSSAPPKPKRVLSDEQKAKMAAGRAAKKQQASSSASSTSAPATASAAPDNEMYVKLPVFRLG